VEVIDLVLAQQESHAVGIPFDALVLEGEHLGEVERRRDADAHARERMRRLFEEFGCVQHRLRRNAADVEAGAAEGGALLDHRHLHAELAGADGADVAARPGTDNDQIVGGHGNSPFKSLEGAAH
jgi:hypothetical protein